MKARDFFKFIHDNAKNTSPATVYYLPVGESRHADDVRRLAAKLQLAQNVLNLVDYTDRTRGYPMPKEWMELVSVARTALAELRKTPK